jgi:tetratricopeptide (TPR) repeat protein
MRSLAAPAVATAFLFVLTCACLHAQHLATDRERRQAVAHYRVGRELMTSEKFDRAAEEFSKAVDSDPLFSLAHYSLGQAYMNLQRYASAIAAFRSCVEATRALHGLAESNRLMVEKQRDDEIQEARETLNSLRTIAARRPVYAARVAQMELHLHDLENQRTSVSAPFQPPAEVLLSLGSAFFRNGDREAAEAQWLAAIVANPKLGEAHNNLAVVYMQTDRFDQAELEIGFAEKNGFRVNPQFKADLKRLRSQN